MPRNRRPCETTAPEGLELRKKKYKKYAQAVAKKGKIIKKIKRDEFKIKIEKITSTLTGLWRLAKYARIKSILFRKVF